MGPLLKRARGRFDIDITSWGKPLRYALALTFKGTNNEAEYEALTISLHLARLIGVYILRVKYDSQLVVNQVKGDYQAKRRKSKGLRLKKVCFRGVTMAEGALC